MQILLRPSPSSQTYLKIHLQATMYARSFSLLVLAALAVIGSMAEAAIAPTFDLEKRKFCFTPSCCVPYCLDPKYVAPAQQ
ncbi:hypothetical protein BGZ82_008524 [Podila clonocystis]|nr:hypothetical protein BGZ82_008524 [Podila clonocystis]